MAEYQSDAASTNWVGGGGELWGVFFNIHEKIDHIITALHCITAMLIVHLFGWYCQIHFLILYWPSFWGFTVTKQIIHTTQMLVIRLMA